MNKGHQGCTLHDGFQLSVPVGGNDLPFIGGNGAQAGHQNFPDHNNDRYPGRNPAQAGKHDQNRSNENLVGQWIKKFPKIGHLIISSGDKAISKVGQNGDQKKNRGQLPDRKSVV